MYGYILMCVCVWKGVSLQSRQDKESVALLFMRLVIRGRNNNVYMNQISPLRAVSRPSSNYQAWSSGCIALASFHNVFAISHPSDD